ncbi:DUF4384 domain-containing protein (plasmid) [Azospirillum sp. TSA2s]|uniref:caspase family protein n=1 Tax=Azospirillum sp. TSA2s TaxID=709810 RepID=UPI0010AA26C0|nr:caspase family protein [Azospirillum sp. TSA2s]QCG93089.1 DUF4384 domain-containing protein [Azospirillum sp. TSA2s]
MSKRLFPTVRAAGLVAAVTAGLLSGAARADMFGLVIGIDDYQHINKLHGAVNDARDIADALTAGGAKDVVLLTNAAAERGAIIAAWDRLLANSRPDDVLVLSYAGHGGQEPEHVKGSEEDGLDEVLLLAGFDTKGPGTAQRIIDDEIAEMMQRAAPRRVIFVSDACHSGTMTRSFDRRAGALGTRFAAYGAIEDDALPPPPREAALIERNDQEHVTFFAAVAENELAPEVYIDNQPRGALSWAFARALRGNADRDGDGVLSKGELEAFIQETVRMKVAGRQHPQVQPTGRGTQPLLPSRSTAAAAAIPNFPAPRPLSLRVMGGDSVAMAAALHGVRPASDSETARLLWDPTTGDVVASQGDVVGNVPGKPTDQATLERLQRVVDKWTLIDRLEGIAERRSLSLALKPDDHAYRKGETFALTVGGHSQTYFTLINIGYDGTVNFLYPQDSGQIHDPLQIATGKPYALTLKVDPPFGADHFVAITSATPLTELHRDLAALDGQPAAAKVGELLARHLQGKAAEIGWHGVYTVGP